MENSAHNYCSPGGSDGRVCLQCGRPGFDPWVRKISWRSKCQSIPVFLPGKFHGWKSLASYSPWGHKESDMTEQLTHTHRFLYPYPVFPHELDTSIHCKIIQTLICNMSKFSSCHETTENLMRFSFKIFCIIFFKLYFG